MDIQDYVNKVVEVIAKEIIFRYPNLNKTVKKYIYLFNNHGIPNHPTLPYSIIKNKKSIYQNDYENIYPIDEIINKLLKTTNLSNLLPYLVMVNQDKSGIIIDWN